MIFILILCFIGLIVGGFLIGFGIRGNIEKNLNKDVEGYRSFWDRNKYVIQEKSE